MSITISGGASANASANLSVAVSAEQRGPVADKATDKAADKVASKGEPGNQMTAAARAKSELNTSIVQASLTVAIGAQNEPLALLLKSAITGINEALRGQYGDDAIQNAMSQDNTPQGTADRIVSLSTGFFEAYKQQHPGEDETASLDKFMSTIRGGMEKGFKEARDILQSLSVLNGDVATNIDRTYELVQKGYADFEAAHKAGAAGSAGTASNAGSAGTAGTEASAGLTDQAA